MGRLLDLELIRTKGKTKGVEYYVNPEFLRKINFKGKTNLKRIEDHRLKELILQDLQTYPNSFLADIHERIGKEIKINKIREQINLLVIEKKIQPDGGRKFRTYSLISLIREKMR